MRHTVVFEQPQRSKLIHNIIILYRIVSLWETNKTIIIPPEFFFLLTDNYSYVYSTEYRKLDKYIMYRVDNNQKKFPVFEQPIFCYLKLKDGQFV